MEVSGKKGQGNGPKAEKDNTERATGLDKGTREEILLTKQTKKWNQTDSPEIPQGGDRNPPASLRRGVRHKDGQHLLQL